MDSLRNCQRRQSSFTCYLLKDCQLPWLVEIVQVKAPILANHKFNWLHISIRQFFCAPERTTDKCLLRTKKKPGIWQNKPCTTILQLLFSQIIIDYWLHQKGRFKNLKFYYWVVLTVSCYCNHRLLIMVSLTLW